MCLSFTKFTEDLRSQKDRQRRVGMECCVLATPRDATLVIVSAHVCMVDWINRHKPRNVFTMTCRFLLAFGQAHELLLPPFLRGKLGRVRRAPAPAPLLGQQLREETTQIQWWRISVSEMNVKLSVKMFMLTLLGAQNEFHKCKGWVEKGWTLSRSCLFKFGTVEVLLLGGITWRSSVWRSWDFQKQKLQKICFKPSQRPTLGYWCWKGWKEQPTFAIFNWFPVVDGHYFHGGSCAPRWQAILAASLLLSLQRSWQAWQIKSSDSNFVRVRPRFWKDPSSCFCLLLFCLHMLNCT